MRWVYLSPHFDDVVLSCGGMLWEQARASQNVQVWTVCAGSPPEGEPLSDFAQSLHVRWQTGPQASEERRAEDQQAVSLLGASARYYDLPDCIYRRLPLDPLSSDDTAAQGTWLVNGEDDLWQPVHPLEIGVVERLAVWLGRELTPDDVLVSPLTLGNHVDHFVTRSAAEQAALRAGCALAYYPDFPYAVGPHGDISAKIEAGWRKECRDVSLHALRAWQASAASYVSQISTFWDGKAGLEAALETYWQSGGGSCLWLRH